MNVDAELEAWRQEWQSAAEPSVAAELRTRVEKQTRHMRLMLAGDILVTVVIGGYTAAWAAVSRTPDVAALATGTWVFILTAWVFAILNHRRSWTPAASNTAAFLELSIERCRGRLRALWFGAILYAVEIVFCLTWIYRYKSVRTPLTAAQFLMSGTAIGVIIITVAFAEFLRRHRRNKTRELAALVELQRQMSESYH